MKVFTKRRVLAGVAITVVAATVTMGSLASADSKTRSRPKLAAAQGLGQLSGFLPRDHLTEESAINVNLTKESVRLPLYKGRAGNQTVWYVLLDASDQGIAHDLGVNFAPKLGNIGIGCPECVQTVTLDSPSPDQNRFGQAVVNFQGAPDFSPTRIAEPGPTGSRSRSSSRAPSPARGTARSSASPARRPSTARRSLPRVTARSTWSTTPTRPIVPSGSMWRARPRPVASPNRGSTS